MLLYFLSAFPSGRVRLEEPVVLDIKFLYRCENPTVVVLYQVYSFFTFAQECIMSYIHSRLHPFYLWVGVAI